MKLYIIFLWKWICFVRHGCTYLFWCCLVWKHLFQWSIKLKYTSTKWIIHPPFWKTKINPKLKQIKAQVWSEGQEFREEEYTFNGEEEDRKASFYHIKQATLDLYRIRTISTMPRQSQTLLFLTPRDFISTTHWLWL